MTKSETRFECEAHGPLTGSSCWTCAASGEMTSRVQVDMSKPVFVPPLPSAERIAEIRAEYKLNEPTAETYGCTMNAKCVRDLLAVLDAAEAARRDAEAFSRVRAQPVVIETPWCPACKMAHAPFRGAE